MQRGFLAIKLMYTVPKTERISFIISVCFPHQNKSIESVTFSFVALPSIHDIRATNIEHQALLTLLVHHHSFARIYFSSNVNVAGAVGELKIIIIKQEIVHGKCIENVVQVTICTNKSRFSANSIVYNVLESNFRGKIRGNYVKEKRI